MADAAAVVMRAERGGGLPWVVGTYRSALERAEATKQDNALYDDPVAPKILELAELGWKGTAHDLLKEITKDTEIEERKYLPLSSKSIGRKLTELTPLLRTRGIVIERRKIGANRWIYITQTSIK
jgi:hypothetical protein